MDEATLFPLPEARQASVPQPSRPEDARVLRPVRQQISWMPRDLEEAVAPDHVARAIWAFLERLNLDAFYASIKAVVDRPGRPTTDPRVLLAVWLLGTVEGVGSARRLARLCEEHDAYRWLCGGVPINYHMLADFRVAHQGALDDLLTQIIGSLMAAGAVTLEKVAQDGMRVRASAGAASFRRKDALKACLKAAREQVERLAQEREQPDPGRDPRKERARERAAAERERRVQEALGYLPQAQAAKDRQQESLAMRKRERLTEARTSTTDPEARVMKMPDGGFRPAYNVEFATAVGSGVILGVGVTSEGGDARQALPMEQQLLRRTGQHPKAYLVDGGFATRETITGLEARGVAVYAPVRLPRNRPEAERYQAKYADTPAVAAWRSRMATEEGKSSYRERGRTAEWTNAQTRQHGVGQFTVRGLANVLSVTLLIAVAHNLLRWAAPG